LADAGAELEGKTRADVDGRPKELGTADPRCDTAKDGADAAERSVCCAS